MMKKVKTEYQKPLGFYESFVKQSNSLLCGFLEMNSLFSQSENL